MNAEARGKAAARQFRSKHELGDQPLGDLVSLIEQSTGIDVAVLSTGPDEHGLAMRDPERGAVFIGVARTTNPMQQRSTLAHELGHVLFEDWTDPSESDGAVRTEEEVRADAFARHLLVPLSGVRRFVGQQRIDQAVLSAVVQRFLVSPAIASIAMRDAHLIEEATKTAWMSLTTPALAAKYGWSDQYRALQDESNRTRSPQQLVARAVEGYLAGVVSIQTLATLRGVSAQIVEEELGQAGLLPEGLATRWAAPGDLPPVEVDPSELEELGEFPE